MKSFKKLNAWLFNKYLKVRFCFIVAPMQKPHNANTQTKAFASVLKFSNGGTNPQQKVYAMRGFSVGIKCNFLISFSNVGRFGAGRANHSYRHSFALLYPALHKLKRYGQFAWQAFRGQWRPRGLRFFTADSPPLADKVTIARSAIFFAVWQRKFRKIEIRNLFSSSADNSITRDYLPLHGQ